MEVSRLYDFPGGLLSPDNLRCWAATKSECRTYIDRNEGKHGVGVESQEES